MICQRKFYQMIYYYYLIFSFFLISFWSSSLTSIVSVVKAMCALFLNIKLISISTANTLKYKNFLKFLLKNNTAIYAFSSINFEFNSKYIGNNITGVYTDFWDIENFYCTEQKTNPILCNAY